MNVRTLALAIVGAGVLYFGGRMALFMSIRGLRNNNPMNIREGNDWLGERAQDNDPEFEEYESPEWGIRAGGKLLLNYQRMYGANSVMSIINRFAPPNENNTTAYISSVSKKLNVAPDWIFNVEEVLPELVEAIIKHECGIQPFSKEFIKDSLRLIEGYDPDEGVYLYAA